RCKNSETGPPLSKPPNTTSPASSPPFSRRKTIALRQGHRFRHRRSYKTRPQTTNTPLPDGECFPPALHPVPQFAEVMTCGAVPLRPGHLEAATDILHPPRGRSIMAQDMHN